MTIRSHWKANYVQRPSVSNVTWKNVECYWWKYEHTNKIENGNPKTTYVCVYNHLVNLLLCGGAWYRAVTQDQFHCTRFPWIYAESTARKMVMDQFSKVGGMWFLCLWKRQNISAHYTVYREYVPSMQLNNWFIIYYKMNFFLNWDLKHIMVQAFI